MGVPTNLSSPTYEPQCLIVCKLILINKSLKYQIIFLFYTLRILYLCSDCHRAHPSSLSLELSRTGPSILSPPVRHPSRDKLPSGDVGCVSDGELTMPESSPLAISSKAGKLWSGRLLPPLLLPKDMISSGASVSGFWQLVLEFCIEWTHAG